MGQDVHCVSESVWTDVELLSWWEAAPAGHHQSRAATRSELHSFTCPLPPLPPPPPLPTVLRRPDWFSVFPHHSCSTLCFSACPGYGSSCMMCVCVWGKPGTLKVMIRCVKWNSASRSSWMITFSTPAADRKQEIHISSFSQSDFFTRINMRLTLLR